MRSARSLACVGLAALLLFIIPSRPAIADIVKCDGNNIGTISTSSYKVQYSKPDGAGDFTTHDAPKVAEDNSGGANFNAAFTFTGCPKGEKLRPGTQFQWVQIVYTNSPQTNAKRGTAPTTGYVDPWGPPGGGNGPDNDGYEDQKPFYWTDAELGNANIGGNPNPSSPPTTLKFSDTSQRGFSTAADMDITWKAELNLVCTWGNMIHSLGYYTWGWKMPKGITGANASNITLDPSPATWTAGASPGLGTLENANEFGAKAHGGWKVTDQDCCVAVPLPPAAYAGLALMALVWARGRLPSVAPIN